MRAIVSPDDLKKGEVVSQTGWHPLEIVDYTEKDAETDGSTNCIFHFKIIDGPDKGLTCNKLFNEKALGFGKALWATLQLPYDKNVGYTLDTDTFKAQIGKKVMGYIAKGESNKGNKFNDLKDFKPLSAA